MHKNNLFCRGIGLMEAVVSTAILTIVFVGFLTLIQVGTKVSFDNKGKTGGLSLALEKIEYIRSLKYDDVGIVGQVPSGSIPALEQVVLNGITYTRTVAIIYIDDPKDGLGVSDSNGIINDYKRAKVRVTWVGRGGPRETSIVSDFVPEGIEK